MHDRPHGAGQAGRPPRDSRRSRTRRLGEHASSRSRTIANGDGPTVLVLGGNHGDEYEGQVAALRLLQELEPEQVTGRVIVVPVLSTAASKANTRNWPSGANFNRSFPGRPDGPPNEQLADYLTRVLFPHGRRGDRHALRRPHAPGSSRARTCTSSTTRRSARRCSRACRPGTPTATSSTSTSTAPASCPVEAENQGKIVITTELGGGGRVPAPVHRLAWSGLNNVLRHVGVLEGEVADVRVARTARRRDPRRPRPGQLRVSPEDGHVRSDARARATRCRRATRRPAVVPRPARPPAELLRAPLDGVVAVSGDPGDRAGDSVFVLGQPIDAAELMHEA